MNLVAYKLYTIHGGTQYFIVLALRALALHSLPLCIIPV